MKLEDLVEHLQEFDLLLDTDPKFPSISGLVIGPIARGSWWADPKAHEMFRLACELRVHPDALLIKLISGKLTFVHRPLWPAIYAIGMAREDWQMRGLSEGAKALLKKADKEKRVDASGDAVRELEARLLVYSRSVHTERGFHAKQLQTWESWVDEVRLGEVKHPVAEAKAQLEKIVARLNKQFNARGTLPWQRRQASPSGSRTVAVTKSRR